MTNKSFNAGIAICTLAFLTACANESLLAGHVDEIILEKAIVKLPGNL